MWGCVIAFWIVFIIIFVCLAIPGTFTMLVVEVLVLICAIIVYALIENAKCKKAFKELGDDPEPPRKLTGEELEKAIDAWEKKWGRKHPTRQ